MSVSMVLSVVAQRLPAAVSPPSQDLFTSPFMTQKKLVALLHTFGYSVYQVPHPDLKDCIVCSTIGRLGGDASSEMESWPDTPMMWPAESKCIAFLDACSLEVGPVTKCLTNVTGDARHAGWRGAKRGGRRLKTIHDNTYILLIN
jgi:hypothetical protein